MFDEKVVVRFWSKVSKDGPIPEAHPLMGNCWIWVPRSGAGGYGQMYVSGKQLYAHRISYIIAYGSIPDGMVIDHKCEVRHCVRPDHLVAATQRDNVHRARSWEYGAALQREKTHCPKGHEYTPENTYFNVRRNRRACRECGRKAVRQYKLKSNPNPEINNTLKTHCKRGHEFTPENTYIIPGTGSRSCKECKRDDVKRFRARKKEQSTNP